MFTLGEEKKGMPNFEEIVLAEKKRTGPARSMAVVTKGCSSGEKKGGRGCKNLPTQVKKKKMRALLGEKNHAL